MENETASRRRFAWPTPTTAVFVACCLWIAMVSVHDAMLVVLNDEVIVEMEQNPLGRRLIELQHGEVWLFVLLKLAGTAVVGAVLLTLYRRQQRWAFTIAAALALFQTFLLAYLVTA